MSMRLALMKTSLLGWNPQACEPLMETPVYTHAIRRVACLPVGVLHKLLDLLQYKSHRLSMYTLNEVCTPCRSGAARPHHF